MNTTSTANTKPPTGRRQPSKCTSERSIPGLTNGGKTPFEIIADFNRQELDKLDYFNRPNKEKARELLSKSKSNMHYSLYSKYMKELKTIKRLEKSLPNDVLEAYVTSDPLYKEMV
jgi:hypothetical protein